MICSHLRDIYIYIWFYSHVLCIKLIKQKQNDHISTVTVPLKGEKNSIEKSQSSLPFPVFSPKSNLVPLSSILVSSP